MGTSACSFRAWRGAALSDGSSMGWQQAAPGNGRGCRKFYRSRTNRGPRNRIAGEGHYAGLLPGAACSQLTDLPSYKAAPLQTMGGRLTVRNRHHQSLITNHFSRLPRPCGLGDEIIGIGGLQSASVIKVPDVLFGKSPTA